MRKTSEETKSPKDVRRDLAQALLDHIDSGTAPWQKQWDPLVGDDTPINAVTGKRYRGINNFWLMLNQPDSDPRWCTFKQAQDNEWKIRKGSHGTTVEKWLVVEKSKEIRVDGEVATLDEKQLIVRFYTVFHASQIEGIPELVKPAAEISLEPDPRVSEILKNMDVSLALGGNKAYYSPGSDVIQMPPLEAFSAASDYDTVLLHEIGHATGHKRRLNRDLQNTFGTPSYAKEELRAEISAAMNAKILGISLDPTKVDATERSGIENSAAYLKGWLSALPDQDRKSELMSAITSAQKISDYVLSFTYSADETVSEAEDVELKIPLTLSSPPPPRMRMRL
jgi:antirestriction protein ArdC